jgi:serine protease AprX
MLDASGSGFLDWGVRCMEWMADPDLNPATDDLPDAVNMSWSVPAFAGTCNSFFRIAAQGLAQLDVVPIAAAGNDALPEIPAAYPEVIAVGAVNRDNQVTSWSGRGPSPCDGATYPLLVAPGTKVRSAWPGGVRRNLRGTSMASPHVAGTVALLRSHKPNLSAAAIMHILKATAVDLGPTGPENSYGFGMVDAYRAFLCLDHGTYSGCGAQCP